MAPRIAEQKEVMALRRSLLAKARTAEAAVEVDNGLPRFPNATISLTMTVAELFELPCMLAESIERRGTGERTDGSQTAQHSTAQSPRTLRSSSILDLQAIRGPAVGVIGCVICHPRATRMAGPLQEVAAFFIFLDGAGGRRPTARCLLLLFHYLID